MNDKLLWVSEVINLKNYIKMNKFTSVPFGKIFQKKNETNIKTWGILKKIKIGQALGVVFPFSFFFFVKKNFFFSSGYW